MSSSRLRLAVGSVLAAAVAFGAQSSLAQETTTSLEEVIVTASKRQERLIDVPSAIDTLSSDQIETLGVAGFDDYADLVPNLDQRSYGAPGYGTVIIRGLNSGPQQTTNTVGFYLDDAPFTASGALSVGSFVTPDPDLADVERIEVLKGPQGTLYGASSLGGLIRIISKRPEFNIFSGNANLSGVTVDGGGSGHGVRASLNVPLLQDRMAMRVSGFHREEPGFVTNIGTGNKNMNEASIYGGKLSLLAQLSDDADLLVSGLYQKVEADGLASQDNVTDTLTPLYGPRKFSSYFDPEYSAEYRTAAATLNWRLGPGTLTTTAAYSKYETYATADYTDSYGPLFAGVLPPNTGVKGDPAPSMDKKTVEMRYASERLGRFEFIAGLFHTDEENTYPISLYGEDIATGQLIAAPLNNIVTTRTTSDYKESAIFGNLTFYVTEAVDFTVGARYAENDQTAVNTGFGLLSGTFTPVTSRFEFDDDATTYLATLRWRINSELTTYLRAASGYRPGGPQTNRQVPDAEPYKSDKVWNYEAGVKGALPDLRLSFGASVYHIVWDDIQLNTLRSGFLFIGNGGKGEVNGFELEGQFTPIDNFVLALSLGYNDTEITRIDAASSESLGARKGDAFPLSPKWGGAMTADYSIPLGVDWTASLGASWKYTGKRPSSFGGAELNPNIDLPAYSTIDLRAALQRGPWKLTLRADNVTDKDGIASFGTNKLFAGQVVPSNEVPIRPRSYGLSLSVDF